MNYQLGTISPLNIAMFTKTIVSVINIYNKITIYIKIENYKIINTRKLIHKTIKKIVYVYK
jgi:hypothetical protein